MNTIDAVAYDFVTKFPVSGVFNEPLVALLQAVASDPDYGFGLSKEQLGMLIYAVQQTLCYKTIAQGGTGRLFRVCNNVAPGEMCESPSSVCLGVKVPVKQRMVDPITYDEFALQLYVSWALSVQSDRRYGLSTLVPRPRSFLTVRGLFSPNGVAPPVNPANPKKEDSNVIIMDFVKDSMPLDGFFAGATDANAAEVKTKLKSVFQQVLLFLVKAAERVPDFQHLDLHLGNVLVSPVHSDTTLHAEQEDEFDVEAFTREYFAPPSATIETMDVVMSNSSPSVAEDGSSLARSPYSVTLRLTPADSLKVTIIDFGLGRCSTVPRPVEGVQSISPIHFSQGYDVLRGLGTLVDWTKFLGSLFTMAVVQLQRMNDFFAWRSKPRYTWISECLLFVMRCILHNAPPKVGLRDGTDTLLLIRNGLAYMTSEDFIYARDDPGISTWTRKEKVAKIVQVTRLYEALEEILLRAHIITPGPKDMERFVANWTLPFSDIAVSQYQMPIGERLGAPQPLDQSGIPRKTPFVLMPGYKEYFHKSLVSYFELF